MKKQLKILLVAGYFPYPATHGGKVDVWNRILGFHKLGASIDLIFTESTKLEESKKKHVSKYINNLFQVDRKNKLFFLLSNKPLQVLSRHYLSSIKINKEYDYLILEGDYVGEILDNKTIKYKKLILRSQNDESLYFNNLAKSTKNIFKKIYYKIESKKFKNYSEKLYNQADRLWFISKDEEVKLNYKNSLWMPSPFPISEIKNQKLDSKNVLFIGSLFMPNNLEGLFWYLKNVHPVLIEKVSGYKLIIVGSTNNTNKQQLINKFNKLTSLDFHFDAPDLNGFYKKSSVFINPMFHGAGVKIKSINAIINGLPLVSTSIGIEGTGLRKNKDFFLADTKDTFIDSVITLLNNNTIKKQLIIESQTFLKNNHYLKLLEKELNEVGKNL